MASCRASGALSASGAARQLAIADCAKRIAPIGVQLVEDVLQLLNGAGWPSRGARRLLSHWVSRGRSGMSQSAGHEPAPWPGLYRGPGGPPGGLPATGARAGSSAWQSGCAPAVRRTSLAAFSAPLLVCPRTYDTRESEGWGRPPAGRTFSRRVLPVMYASRRLGHQDRPGPVAASRRPGAGGLREVSTVTELLCPAITKNRRVSLRRSTRTFGIKKRC